MAMIEIGGKGDVKVKDSTTTSETLIKSRDDLKADVDNCHTGLPATKSDTKEKGLLVKCRDWILEHSIKSAVGLVITGLLGYLASRLF